MAITKIHPVKTTVQKSVDYICNPHKTDNRILVESQRLPEADKASPAERISIYVENPRSVKNLAFSERMYLPRSMIRSLEEKFGAENVSLTPGKMRV